ncbi:MAG: lipocalin family protein [Thiotrichales bacterium]|nr:MAG: lipocalin family protein [Thiotrichales bacterium]
MKAFVSKKPTTAHAFIVTMFTLTAGGCTGLPEGVEPVEGFEVNRYLGQWYEIARLDHSFERGLSNVSADYALGDGGGISVINRGFSQDKGQWKQAEGKAKFVTDEHTGHLKVSFFGPFYGSYVVFELDKEEYQYAFVAGYNKSYLWLLSRTPTVSEKLLDRFISRSTGLGFDTTDLILVDHAAVTTTQPPTSRTGAPEL